MRDVVDAIADNANANHLHAGAVRALYVARNLGDPPDTFPDYAQLEDDPIGAIRDFVIATNSGTNGGINPASGRVWVTARQWARLIHARNITFHQACKHIWETVVSTFSSVEATTMMAGLPYGSGPKLFARVKNTQQRQTTMTLLTLFIQLITIQLKPNEKIAGLYGRVLEIKARLENWDPPVVLSDKLLMVCMLRLLPRVFHQTRTIIMTQKGITLNDSKEMFLDVETRMQSAWLPQWVQLVHRHLEETTRWQPHWYLMQTLRWTTSSSRQKDIAWGSCCPTYGYVS